MENIWKIEKPCMSENHQLYIAGKGYVKLKDLKKDDVIINETNGKTNRITILDINIHKSS